MRNRTLNDAHLRYCATTPAVRPPPPSPPPPPPAPFPDLLFRLAVGFDFRRSHVPIYYKIYRTQQIDADVDECRKNLNLLPGVSFREICRQHGVPWQTIQCTKPAVQVEEAHPSRRRAISSHPCPGGGAPPWPREVCRVGTVLV